MMAIVTKLEPMRLYARRVRVYLDGEAWRTLEKTSVRALDLSEGREADEERLQRACFEPECEAARERALRMLESKACTAAEIERDLRRREFLPGAVERTIERLAGVGLLDDAALALRQAEASSGRSSRRAVMQKLRGRGVSAEALQEAQDGLSDEAELQAARREVDKRLRGCTDPDREARGRIVQALARKGFSYDTAKRALADALSGMQDDG